MSTPQDAEKARVLAVLTKHCPDMWNWSCTCGDMPSSDYRRHPIAHREHLADALTSPEKS